MGEERFSRRFGHRPEEHEIIVREDAPEAVRGAILTIAESDLDLKPSYLREVLCSVLRKLPDHNNWSEYPNVWGEYQSLIEDCPWYRVYDFVEALYQHLQKQGDWDRATRWQDLINDYFLEAGIGWRMVNGLLETRGPEAFVAAVDTARNTLHETKLPTARQEIHEALRGKQPEMCGQHWARYSSGILIYCLSLSMRLPQSCGVMHPRWRAIFGKVDLQRDQRQSYSWELRRRCAYIWLRTQR
jgi:AbiJ N-terminal domain 4